ncbi:hypothetical protein [Fervidibacter sp.]|jgi:hypothetical protein
MTKMRRRISPAVVLFVLEPAVGELLSGSSPPVEFFNPFAFFLLAALYGGGAILVRELVFKWRMGITQHEFAAISDNGAWCFSSSDFRSPCYAMVW